MKREKLNLGEKVAVICEGGAETAIMEMLLDAGRLIFTVEDLFYDEIIRCRSAEIFEQRYLKVKLLKCIANMIAFVFVLMGAEK